MVCGRGGLFGVRRGGRTFGGFGLQGKSDESLARNILKFHSLKRERNQERLSLKEDSSFNTLSKGRSSKAQLQQTEEKNLRDRGARYQAVAGN